MHWGYYYEQGPTWDDPSQNTAEQCLMGLDPLEKELKLRASEQNRGMKVNKLRSSGLDGMDSAQ